jgi:hypothetical protein
MLKQTHKNLRNWVTQTQKPLRQLHHIEEAAVNKGFVATQMRVRQGVTSHVEYKPINTTMVALYKRYEGLTHHGTLPHVNAGIQRFTPNDMPEAFKKIVVSPKRKRSKHKLRNLPYTLIWGELNTLKCNTSGQKKHQFVPIKSPLVAKRANQLFKLNNMTALSLLAGTPLVGVVASGLTGHGLIHILGAGLMGTSVGSFAAFLSHVNLPKAFTLVRHAAERTAFNAVRHLTK